MKKAKKKFLRNLGKIGRRYGDQPILERKEAHKFKNKQRRRFI
jgi:hypothetical protein